MLAVGGVKYTPALLAQAYEEACQAMQMRFFHQNKNVLFYSKAACEIFPFDSSLISQFCSFLQQGDFSGASSLVQSTTRRIVLFPGTPPSMVRDLYFRLFSQLSEQAGENFSQEFFQRPEIAGAYQSIYSAESIGDLSDCLLKAVSAYQTFYSDKNGRKSYAEQAEQLVKEHFSKRELSLEWIADTIGISPPYLSAVFKNQKGISLNKYINDFRIGQACRLLRGTNTKISQIACLTGYGDHAYFAKIFRRETGFTPREYREGKQK